MKFGGNFLDQKLYWPSCNFDSSPTVDFLHICNWGESLLSLDRLFTWCQLVYRVQGVNMKDFQFW